MGTVETHLDLFQREIKDFLELGYFVQDYRASYEKGKRTYLGDKADVDVDPILATNSFRRMARMIAAEHKRPFIWVRLYLEDWRDKEYGVRAQIVIPKRKSTQPLIAAFRVQEPELLRWGSRYGRFSMHDGYGVVTIWAATQQWQQFQKLMEMSEIRAAMKLPPRLRIAA